MVIHGLVMFLDDLSYFFNSCNSNHLAMQAVSSSTVPILFGLVQIIAAVSMVAMISDNSKMSLSTTATPLGALKFVNHSAGLHSSPFTHQVTLVVLATATGGFAFASA